MTDLTNTCQDCAAEYLVSPTDQAFYQKIDVSVPTYCPRCVLIHMSAWRNQRVLYQRQCDKTDQPIISTFSPESPYTVYSHDAWWSDEWDPLEFGREIDFSRPFFPQFDELMKAVPQVNIHNSRSENSDYCNFAERSNNCYLLFGSYENEFVLYSEQMVQSRDSVDCLEMSSCEGCYESVSCNSCYNIHYSDLSDHCRDSYFLYDCKNCSDCIGCTNLRNKQYYIFNTEYSKEEYEAKKAQFGLNSRQGLASLQQRFAECKANKLHRFAVLVNCEDSTGNNLVNVKDSHDCFAIRSAQRCAYVINNAPHMEEIYYGYGVGDYFSRGYQVFGTGAKAADVYCCGMTLGIRSAYYSYNCYNSSDIFGCVGLRQKKRCILNKQYSDEEYTKLRNKLIQHMKETSEWGQFFPAKYSPFGLNETLAQDYANYSKERAVELGFRWQDNLPFTTGKETASLEKLTQRIADTTDEVVNEVFACADCGKNYKVTEQELQFYRQKDVPAPHHCPNCRHLRRKSVQAPHQLWQRQCACDYEVYENSTTHAHHTDGRCPNQLETVYDPERSEIVYCEDCYLAEVV